MIDFHSHVLPKMDDGSKSIEESVTLLKMLSQQGIKTVVATPHFYADNESADSFFQRRQQAFESLKPFLEPVFPRVVLGAEVRYYEGISRHPSLQSFCIDGGRMLLLEMPFARWTEYTVRELVELASMGDLNLALAHIERYLFIQNEQTRSRLFENGVLMQVNADFINDFFTRKKAFSLVKRGMVHLIGSDCHNVKYRPPNIGKAYQLLESKFGNEFLCNFVSYGETVSNISHL